MEYASNVVIRYRLISIIEKEIFRQGCIFRLIYNKSQNRKLLHNAVVMQTVSYLDMYCSLFFSFVLGLNNDIVPTRYVCWKWSHAVLRFIKCWLHLRLAYFKDILMSAHIAIDVYCCKIFETHLLLHLDKKALIQYLVYASDYSETKDEIYSIRLCNWIKYIYRVGKFWMSTSSHVQRSIQ